MFKIFSQISSMTAVLLMSLALPFSPAAKAQVINQTCTQGVAYNNDQSLVNENNRFYSSNKKVCKDVVILKRIIRINPNNIDDLLSSNLEQIKANEIQQFCLNYLKVNNNTELNNTNNQTNINSGLKCKFVFRETNIYKVAKGDRVYLAKVARLFNLTSQQVASIFGGSELDIDNTSVADNNSNDLTSYSVKTVLVSRVVQKNIIKLWNKSTPDDIAYLQTLISPSSTANVECVKATNNNSNLSANSGSNINNTANNDLACKVNITQTNIIR
jgi:hypothetical protein